jgi:hypothetical protein
LTTHLFTTDQHAHYKHNNKRADYLAELVLDTKPDTVIFGGDLFDMPSLSSFDKGRKAFQGRTYRADIDTGSDFLDRYFTRLRRAKKRLPRHVALEGNHENRLKKAINIQPELEGTIDFSDFGFDKYFDDVVEYDGNTPGVITIDGIHYAHFFISGIMGRPIGGEHPAASLLAKQSESCSAGHSHLADLAIRTAASGRKNIGLLGGCYQDYDADWAGVTNRLWWRGCVLKRNVEKGVYDPEFISIDRLKKAYG